MKRLILTIIICLIATSAMLTAAQDDATPITYGETITGTVSAESPSQFYSFDAAAGDNVLIDLQSDDFDTYLYLRDADGAEVTSDDDGGSGFNSRLQGFDIPVDGTYIIEATSYSNATRGDASAGDFTLELDLLEVTPIEYGQVIEGDSTGLIGIFDFVAEQDTAVSIVLEAENGNGGLSLVGPNGFEVSSGTFVDGSVTRISPYIVPQAGTYQIVADGTGAYTLRLERVDITPAEIGTPVTGIFDADNDLLYFSFQGEQDDIVDIIVDSGNTLDTALALYSPFGYESASSRDASNTVDPALSAYSLNDTGRFIVVISPQNPNAALSGEVTLTIAESTLQSLDDGPVSLSFNENTTEQIVTFGATAGETVRLIVELQRTNSFSTPSLYIQQNGMTITNLNLGGIVRLTADLVIDDTGEVNVRVTSFDSSDITLSLERLDVE